jgi:hypothetical protein
MNAYVLGYKVDVEFGPEPSQQSRYTVRGLAEAACRELNKLAVSTDTHQCSFAVATLPEGDFGIICVCHPHSLGPARAIPVPQNQKSRSAGHFAP